jgi:large subunit ribosomal protein L29
VKASEIRELTAEEIKTRLLETNKEIVHLRFQLAARKLENVSKLAQARKNLSRLLTIQSEKERQVAGKK